MGDNLDRLKQQLGYVHHLSRAAAVLGWDQQTYMPPGGAAARAEQLAALSRLAHDMFTADETGRLIAAATTEVQGRPNDDDDASLVRVAQRDYDKERRVPPALVSDMRRHASLANAVWVDARKNGDFAAFAPFLERTVQLNRQLAESLGYEDELYDALLDQFEPGMKTAEVRSLFNSLKTELVSLVREISESPRQADDAVLHQQFDESLQEEFGRHVAERFGYDFSRGRQDRTVHPFETTFSRNDVRITTRFEPDFLSPALFGTMHETGHALYEQGVGETLEGTLLARGASLGVHESQSRMWENVVGRSRAFWQHYFPRLQSTFPAQLHDVSLDSFYTAINKVQPSLIRVEADEVTYNLHIMLRFEMEQDLLNGVYPVRDAPEVWNHKMDEYLGIRPPNDSLGILQDIHWTGTMGYFPTYALGNILSLQIYQAALKDMPDVPEHIADGEFESLLGWLTEKIYRHGRKFEPDDLVRRATGEPLQTGSYLAYLRRKYGEIYRLDQVYEAPMA